MKEYNTESIRNIALVSHSGAGKTMLAEAFLHFIGATTRLGRIEDGTTTADFEEEEVRRGISLSTAILPIEYRDQKINLLDTPGYTDFIGEEISALSVADGAVVVVDSVAGAEVGTEIAWHHCDRFHLPRFVVINKMNRDNANFQKALDSVQAISDVRLLPVQLPWGEKQNFKGVLDLLNLKAYSGDGKTAADIPADFQSEVETARMALIEAAAEGEDELLMKYLEGEQLAPEEIRRGLLGVFRSGAYIPVFAAAGSAEIGLAPLLDAFVDLMPSPADVPAVTAKGKNGETEELTASDSGPLAVYVWKTTADPFVGKITYFRVYSGILNADSRVWNQTKKSEERLGSINLLRGKEALSVKSVHAGDIGSVPKLATTSTGDTLCDRGHPLELTVPDYPSALFRVAVNPKTQADAAKLSPTLTRLCEEDMTLSWYQEQSTSQTILQGMGDQHIDVAVRKAESKFQTAMTTEVPRVPFQETITKKGQAMYRHKKQTGGAGQFGEVWMRTAPSEEEYEFSWDVFGGAISGSFQPAIEKGIRSVMKEGVLAGFPMRSISISVYDGKEHPVDSKPVAFEIAARECFKLSVKDSGPVLLEPIMNVEITVPEANMGDIMGDLNTRRARVQGMNTEKGHSIITAQVPLAEMQRYTTDLRSMTGGRGVFSMEFSHYEVVPAHIAQEIITTRQKEIQAAREE